MCINVASPTSKHYFYTYAMGINKMGEGEAESQWNVVEDKLVTKMFIVVGQANLTRSMYSCSCLFVRSEFFLTV